MDTVHITIADYSPVELFTIDEKTAKLQELFQEMLPKYGQIFLPPIDFYAPLSNDKDLSAMAHSIFTWLGIKHRNLVVLFSAMDGNTSGTYIEDGKKHRIIINQAYQTNPYYCAAILTHCVMHYLLISRAKLVLAGHGENEQLTDLATVYSGLGIVMLNGQNYHIGLRHQLRAALPAVSLGHFSATVYANELYDWAFSQRIIYQSWAVHVMPWARKYLPKKLTLSKKPINVLAVERQIRMVNVKLAGVGLCATAFIATCAFVVSMLPHRPSAAQRAQTEKIQLLQQKYTACRQGVEQKTSSQDTSNIYVMRNIEGDANRCESYRNEYNYEVDDYESRYGNL